MTRPQLLLTTKDLKIGYPAQTLPGQFSLEIYAGDLIAIIGKNGQGKTTLLKTLAGLLAPVQGQIFLGGRELGQWERSALARQRAVMLTEHPVLNFTTTREVLTYGRYPWGQEKQGEVLAQVVADLGLEAILNLPFTSLSDGQKQKVWLGLALMQTTPLLLLDEPTTFLDTPHKFELMHQLLRQARQRKQAVIFTTHDWPLCLQTATRVWAMDGEEFWDCLPEELIIQKTLAKIWQGPEHLFDENAGIFKAKFFPSADCFIDLKGQGLAAVWAAHALRKVGAVVQTEFEQASIGQAVPCLGRTFSVQADADGFSITLAGAAAPFSRVKTITELLNALEIF